MKKIVSTLATITLAGMTLAGCSSDDPVQTVDEQANPGTIFEVADPWIRATEETMETGSDHSMTGAFVHLTNVSGQDQTVIGADSDVAQLVELHEVVDDGGVNVMQEKPGGFKVAADETYELNPGEDHVMLMELAQPIAPGDIIDITLELETGETQDIEFIAKEFVGAQENYGDLDHHENHDHDQSEDQEQQNG